jgi:hypothetical protein
VVSPLELLSQTAQCRGLVPVLAPLLPARHHEPRGEVDQADPALGAVLVLAPLSPGHEGLHPALCQELVIALRDGKEVGGGHFIVHENKMEDIAENAMRAGSPLQASFG